MKEDNNEKTIDTFLNKPFLCINNINRKNSEVVLILNIYFA